MTNARMVSFSRPQKIDEAQVARLLEEHASQGVRVLREVLHGTHGLRFQFADGLVVDWLDGEFSVMQRPPVPELRR